jgi:phosphoglycerate kinase
LRPLIEPLSRAVGGKTVRFAPDCVGPEAAKIVDALQPGEVALLENLRFHAGEEKNDPAFAKQLAALGDVYVDDAFSAAHRAHASIAALAHLLPAAAGKNMQAELEALGAALENPQRPVLALGEMADTAREILAQAKERGCAIILPEDAVTAEKLEAGAVTRTVGVNAVPANAMILDIGPQSVARLDAALEASRTLVWNGPVGAFETQPFDRGTIAIAKQVAALTEAGELMSVAGGGDTVAALAAAGVTDDLTYVSTAGGAFLEWLEGRELPGVAALAVS